MRGTQCCRAVLSHLHDCVTHSARVLQESVFSFKFQTLTIRCVLCRSREDRFWLGCRTAAGQPTVDAPTSSYTAHTLARRRTAFARFERQLTAQAHATRPAAVRCCDTPGCGSEPTRAAGCSKARAHPSPGSRHRRTRTRRQCVGVAAHTTWARPWTAASVRAVCGASRPLVADSPVHQGVVVRPSWRLTPRGRGDDGLART